MSGHHRWGLKHRHAFSHGSGGWKSPGQGKGWGSFCDTQRFIVLHWGTGYSTGAVLSRPGSAMLSLKGLPEVLGSATLVAGSTCSSNKRAGGTRVLAASVRCTTKSTLNPSVSRRTQGAGRSPQQCQLVPSVTRGHAARDLFLIWAIAEYESVKPYLFWVF